MERILILLGIIFSLNANAAVPSGVPAIGVGAASSAVAPSTVPLNNPTGGAGTFAVFTLVAGDEQNALTTTNVYPFYKVPTATGGTGYQVTAGKSLYCFDVSVIAATAGQAVGLITDTAAFVFNATTASLTAAKYYSGNSGKYNLDSGPTGHQWNKNPGIYVFPASSFPGIQAPSVILSVVMNCYEN